MFNLQVLNWVAPMPNSTSKSTEPTEALAEPGPDWPVAKKLWGLAWELHWIGFGSLFGLLAIHSFLALVLAKQRKGFGRKPLFIAINSLLFTLGATRAVYLLLDPYESRENGVEDPKWLTLLLFGIAYPCLTSAFCLIHLAFLEVTKLKVGPSKLQDARFLSGVIIFHFIIVFTAETSSSIKPELDALLIVCQSFFILWGLLLSGSFIYSGWKVINRVENVQEQLSAIEKNEHLKRKNSKSSTTKVAKITLGTSFLGFAVCGLHLYSMVGVYGMYSRAKLFILLLGRGWLFSRVSVLLSLQWPARSLTVWCNRKEEEGKETLQLCPEWICLQEWYQSVKQGQLRRRKHDVTWRENLAEHDMTSRDMTWHDMTWLDITRHDETWRDVTRRDKTWQDMTRLDKTRHDETWHDVTWHDMTSRDGTWHIHFVRMFIFKIHSLWIVFHI